MILTEHFTVAEFTRSDTARERGIDNTLPPRLYAAALQTCQMLERIRAHLGAPVLISSGYRCLQLNRAVGSSDTSDHVRARAADFTAPGFGTPFEVCRALAEVMDVIGIGQLIHERPKYGNWIHVGALVPVRAVNRVITISRRGTEPGILEG